MNRREQDDAQRSPEERIHALEQKVMKLEGKKSRPLGAGILLIVFVVALTVFVAIGTNIDRPGPQEEQVDPIVWTQVVSAAAILFGSLGSLFLRVKGSPFWGEVTALTILVVGALFVFVGSLSQL